MRRSLADLKKLYNLPFTELIYRAQDVHHANNNPAAIRLCSALSIKTGRCPEDCAYCPQSAHNKTAIVPQKLLDKKAILNSARKAKANGASRMSLGAAWGRTPGGTPFQSILESVSAIKEQVGIDVCCSIGTIDADQALQLLQAGCTTYNHNLDTSRDYYKKIITSRSYDKRLETLKTIQSSGLHLCSGGILGMGESIEDRLKLLLELSNLNPHPQSVPINSLESVPGTKLENRLVIDPFEFTRIIALARILMPESFIGLAAGRHKMNQQMQSLCFLAGANQIILGNKIFTTPNQIEDNTLLNKLTLKGV